MKVKNKSIEELKEIKRLLIIVDMVNGFVKEGALAAKSIERIIPRNIELIEEFLNDTSSAVFFIRDSHTEKAVEFNVFGKHCLKNSKESEMIPELIDYEKYGLTYLKNSTNFVFAPDFQKDILKLKNLKQVVLNGCLTDYCIKNGAISLRNLFDQYDRDVEIIVDEAGVDTFDAPNHNREAASKRALEDMASNGIIVKKYGGK